MKKMQYLFLVKNPNKRVGTGKLVNIDNVTSYIYYNVMYCMYTGIYEKYGLYKKMFI